MPWFQSLCRSTGRMIHEIVKPVRGGGGGKGKATERREVSRNIEEKRVSPTVTLRRTTIEEVEVRTPQRTDATDDQHWNPPTV